MRKLSQITANIVPFPTPARSFGRRPLRSFAGQLTSLVLFKHQETDAMVSVSDDNDPVGACWIPKAMMAIDPKDRGRFLVVTISAKLARDKGLGTPIIDRERFTPDERTQLEEAIATAARARKRRLNAYSGTTYRWKLIFNHLVNRLMLGHLAVDLHDQDARGHDSCRGAIDEEMQRIARDRKAP